ncbi:MAG: hypothetical protein L6Q97_18895 [Thermoanaerobaculia bacterium]|nr:hypothetical protein [Thermoanaerobaculia bacterium]
MNALLRPTVERRIFYLMLLAAILPVWSGRFFVTGDGPCHVYNARILLDYIMGRHFGFYDPFYSLNTNFEPNWFGHLWLAFFQLFFAPETAEKVFLSGYVAMFGLGLRYLIRQINPESGFMSVFGLLFAWHFLLQSGFYNYACSIALFFWVCGFWLQYRHSMTPVRGLVWALLWLVLYSAHPMGLVFAGLFVGCNVLWEGLLKMWKSGWKKGSLLLWQQTQTALLSALPMLVLFAEYIYRKPWPTGANTESVSGVWNQLYNLGALMIIRNSERDTVRAISYIAIALALGAIVLYLRRRPSPTPNDANDANDANDINAPNTHFLLLFTALALWQYFRQAGAQSLELMMPLRVQLFPWLGLLLWTAGATFPQWARQLTLALSATAMIVLLTHRIPAHRKASELVEDYMSCLPHIADSSVILVLNYDFSGRYFDGREVSNRNWLFIHAADYIGAYRTAIMSDNYEALRYYFPLIWRWERDMFRITDKEGMNFENRPPRADFINFKNRSGGFDLHYVLLLNYDERHYDHDYSREIIGQLEAGYEHVFFSPRGKAELWRLKK